ncbi:MAG: hypothetical protein P8M22_06675 [Phycisphaerales bacterium]|nr:hypothetical protein [Phycisphaerales bacterium]
MSRLRDEIEQLTARLTTDPVGSPERPSVCVLLMGHLPVRAGLWRLPAARRLLPDCEQILVVRSDGGQLFIECIGEFPGTFEAGDAILDSLPSSATVVLVPASGPSCDDVMSLDPDSIGLVTGGDQAATAGAYRMLKSMKIPRGKDIGLVVAGSEDESVQDTADRLHEAVENHLGLNIQLKGSISKIEADTGLTQSAVIDCPAGGLSEIVQRVRRGVRGSDPAEKPSAKRVVSSGDSGVQEPTVPAAAPLPAIQALGMPSEHVDEPCVRLSPAAMPPLPQWSNKESSACTESIDAAEEPVPISQHVTTEPVNKNAPSLCEHVPGLRSLPVQCPDHEVVEFAVDELGAIHLLARCEEVLHLPTVLSWIKRHHSLLEMALPGTVFDRDDEPVVHVIGEDVDSLCGLRNSAWQPHLLVRVDPLPPSGWASVPLGKA